MLKLRLQRVGRKNNPSYRVLVVDSRQGPKSGKYIDHIGSYDPKDDRITIDGEKAKSWLAKGVHASRTVHNLLVSQKIIEGKKINVHPRKSPIKKENDAKEAVPAAETPVAVVAPEEVMSEAETPVTEIPAEEAITEPEQVSA